MELYLWLHAGDSLEGRQRTTEGGGTVNGTVGKARGDGRLGRMMDNIPKVSYWAVSNWTMGAGNWGTTWTIKRRKYLSGAKRREIWEKFNKRCVCCGCETSLFGNTVSPFQEFTPCAIDHIVPFSRGGNCEDDNLQLLCISCNASKGNKYDPSN